MNRISQSNISLQTVVVTVIAALMNGIRVFRFFLSPLETAGTEKISHAYLL